MITIWMKDHTYTLKNDGKVPYMSSYTLNVFYSKWCSLVANELVTQLVDWVKLILVQLISMGI